MSLDGRLDRIVARAEELRALLSDGAGGEAFVRASKELSELEPIVARVDDLRAAQRSEDEARVLLADPDMKELAEAELLERVPAPTQESRRLQVQPLVSWAPRRASPQWAR